MPRANSLLPPFLKMLVHGDTGTGKTRLAASAVLVPEMRPVLFFDFEAGRSSAASIPGLDPEQIIFWDGFGQKDLLLLETKCKNPDGNLKTIVVDSLTEMYGLMMSLHLQGSGREGSPPQIQDYGFVTNRMMKFLRGLQQHPAVHFLATAGTTLDKDELSGEIHYQPDILGKLNYRAGRFFDIVGYLSTSATKRGKSLVVARSLQTQPFGRKRAKDRFGKLPPVMKDPTMSKIYELIYGS